ncbi:hypothetical protein [Nocardia transvalensis]|uniref:hypothetical protein n=1 Tax=Nocardia transvalensis TaxID=37333 RepID=UPI001895F31C|nr:hypothetical protein [Nocardia transvalensis]MBF6333632.1 hypothetical protein [Nocardia transvalensis]
MHRGAEQAPTLGAAPPGPHRAIQGLGDIVTRHGVDVVIERISQLHADGNHHAASCIGWELVHLDVDAPVAAPEDAQDIQDIQDAATRLFMDPADETIALEVVTLLAARFPVIAVRLGDHTIPQLRGRELEPPHSAPDPSDAPPEETP